MANIVLITSVINTPTIASYYHQLWSGIIQTRTAITSFDRARDAMTHVHTAYEFSFQYLYSYSYTYRMRIVLSTGSALAPRTTVPVLVYR